MDERKKRELQEAENMAYFRAELCTLSPQSYTLEEKKKIYDDMVSSSKAIVDTMRSDFEKMSPEMQKRMLEMLCQSGVETPEWWKEALTGNGSSQEA